MTPASNGAIESMQNWKWAFQILIGIKILNVLYPAK